MNFKRLTSSGEPIFEEAYALYENSFPHVHPPYREGYKGHSLVIMACPSIESTQYRRFAPYLADTVMADSPNE